MNSIEDALKYIENAGGEPKMAWLIEDAEPIGAALVDALLRKKWAIITTEAKIILTALGEDELARIKR